MVKELGEGGLMITIKCDLTNDEEVDTMFSQIMKTWGGIDVCINNAAQIGSPKIMDGDRKEWRNLIDLNVIAYCYCAKKTVESLKERDCDEGHIINICRTDHWSSSQRNSGYIAVLKVICMRFSDS
ncbi:unnamed protein product [Darwinula stevensoni]|uniref:Uncharacterized protein n=1 Tax=Darwinula stevensoni TaxID=69355 RepID=A0A7R9AI19_9CRUS|nr:unnamed protein product [Darwinula stevensoni]CAG0906317.1 unnamed protein product [Darwinula stevensoni]